MKKIYLIVLTISVVLCAELWSCEKENAGDGSMEWVDLGLPSGLLWARWNLGATKPEEYGNYYAWGETAPKKTYTWNTYMHCIDGNSSEFTKYCYLPSYGYNDYTDSLTMLQPIDDAATAALGDGARIPTNEEWNELDSVCSKRWTSKHGVKGYKYKGPNGNTLFLPAGGYRWEDTLCDDGSRGLYWSSSLWMDYPERAWGYRFNWLVAYRHYAYRCEGFSVRAVKQ